MTRIIKVSKIDKAEWNYKTPWDSYALASHIIKNPELISPTAWFEASEYIIPMEGRQSRRCDLIFEDEKNIYLIECESSSRQVVGGVTESMKRRMNEYWELFSESYKGDKSIKSILVAPLTARGVNTCPHCGSVLNEAPLPSYGRDTWISKTDLKDYVFERVRNAGEGGITRSELYRKTSNDTIKAVDINVVLSELVFDKKIEQINMPSTGGRPPIIFRVKD